MVLAAQKGPEDRLTPESRVYAVAVIATMLLCLSCSERDLIIAILARGNASEPASTPEDLLKDSWCHPEEAFYYTDYGDMQVKNLT